MWLILVILLILREEVKCKFMQTIRSVKLKGFEKKMKTRKAVVQNDITVEIWKVMCGKRCLTNLLNKFGAMRT